MIPFKGLKDGLYEYTFEISKKFFEHYDQSEIQEGLLQAKVSLDKNPQFLELTFQINGYVNIMCDRCLDFFDLYTESRNTMYFRFGEESIEISDDVIVLSEGETEINVAQYIYEFIHLSLPYKRIHPDKNGKSKCDPQMINKLDLLQSKDLNIKSDPRWDKLKDIIEKN